MCFGKYARYLAFSVLFFFAVGHLYGQENYLPAYVVGLNRDTVKGLVDYRKWTSNPRKIFYKKDPTEVKKAFTPADIRAFGVAGLIYESGVIDVAVDFPNPYSHEVEVKKDMAFVQAVIHGPKSLYVYSREIGKDQFYIRYDSIFELLAHKRFQRGQSEETLEDENNRYRAQLSYYLRDCPAVQSELKYVRYNRTSLQNLFLEYYHKCAQKQSETHERIEKTRVQVGVIAGLTLNSLKFSGAAVPTLTETNYKTSLSFSGGLFLEANLPAARRKWSLYTELLFTSYKFTGAHQAYLDPADQSQYVVTSTTIGLSYIKSNDMLRFQYPIGKVRFFMNGGFSTGVVVHDTNHEKQVFQFYSTSPATTSESTALNGIRQYELGYLLGFGAKLKNYSLEFRYERSDGMSEYIELRSKTVRWYFLFAYRLRP